MGGEVTIEEIYQRVKEGLYRLPSKKVVKEIWLLMM
jgi:hypothetical protein